MGDEFNGTIYFMIRGSNMAAKQEAASIITYIYPNRLIFLLCRFLCLTNTMAPFIFYFDDPIWPPIRKWHRSPLIFMQIMVDTKLFTID